MTKLRPYRAKRRFTRTPEPYGVERGSDPDALSFVIQHHAARRPHFDLRLEWDGVLQSWALPEGPSTDPAERRLAVETEAHPLDYADFEGEIPPGQYGAGIMRLWDRGSWVPLDDPSEALAAGELKFRLVGTRLTGGWMLKRLPDGKAWLLIKERDQGVGAPVEVDLPALEKVEAAPNADLPKRLRPQLPTAAEVAPEGPGWIHEIKYDGYRTLVWIDNGAVRMLTRQGLDWTDRYGALAGAFRDLDCRAALIDGEVVAQDVRGATSLDLLQETLSAGRDQDLVFFAFDLVHLDGRNLAPSPLLARKAALRRLIPEEGRIQFSDHMETDGRDLFAQVCRMGLEGIVSKKSASPYREGRTTAWLKVKRFDIGTFTVIGFTTKAARTHASSLILAEDVEGLAYVGRAGSGLGNDLAKQLYVDLSPQRIDGPSVAVPKLDAEHTAHWIAPGQMTAEISYRGRSTRGILKQPVVLGVTAVNAPTPKRRQSMITDRDLATIRLTNPDREILEGSGVSKLDVAIYYARVGEAMLPDLMNRPVTLIRSPTGRDTFYQRHGFSGLPDGVETMGDRREEEFLVIRSARGFLALPQFGTLEFHPRDCLVEDLDHPDRMTIDLDPGDGVGWAVLATAAEALRDRLAASGLTPFVRTTGGAGLHLVVPIANAPWDRVKTYLSGFVEAAVRDAPRLFTGHVAPQARPGRIYLDVNRTRPGASAVGTWSLRARPGFPAAVPLDWHELGKKVARPAFDIKSALERADTFGKLSWAILGDARAEITNTALRDVGKRG